jgi:hypothetical protein
MKTNDLTDTIQSRLLTFDDPFRVFNADGRYGEEVAGIEHCHHHRK